jgi:hypothetical protein
MWCLWMRLASLCCVCSYTALQALQIPKLMGYYTLLDIIYHRPYFYHTTENLLGHLLHHLVLLLSGICIFALHARCLQWWQAGTIILTSLWDWVHFSLMQDICEVFFPCKIWGFPCFHLVSVWCWYRTGFPTSLLLGCIYFSFPWVIAYVWIWCLLRSVRFIAFNII